MTTTFTPAGTEVLAPGDAGYNKAAATMFATGMPDLVVRPSDATGVTAALRHAAEAGLTVSVRSGGHSLAGFGTHTDGMVIDLRRLDGVRVLDQDSRRVRIGTGATWGAVSTALRRRGLALTAGDTTSVGVGGLTLAGGIGWMARRYGLAIDNLAGADVVTADGRVIRADPTRPSTAACSGRCAAGAATSASWSASTSPPSRSPPCTSGRSPISSTGCRTAFRG
jgi:FAD/FMN-containing dehydrogenase